MWKSACDGVTLNGQYAFCPLINTLPLCILFYIDNVQQYFVNFIILEIMQWYYKINKKLKDTNEVCDDIYVT